MSHMQTLNAMAPYHVRFIADTGLELNVLQWIGYIFFELSTFAFQKEEVSDGLEEGYRRSESVKTAPIGV